MLSAFDPLNIALFWKRFVPFFSLSRRRKLRITRQPVVELDPGYLLFSEYMKLGRYRRRIVERSNIGPERANIDPVVTDRAPAFGAEQPSRTFR